MEKLPWVEPFLESVRQEYVQAPPPHQETSVTAAEYHEILSLAAEADPFDTEGLKADTAAALKAKKAVLHKSISPLGTICVISFESSPFFPPWKTWWRAVRLLSPQKPVKILIFGHPKRRIPPPKHQPLKPAHLNGGSAYRCNPQSIVLYRKEEATRVLIHELFHASCSDPYHKDTPEIEADTEAWAEILLCAMAAKGQRAKWARLLREQIQWARRQAATAKDHHGVKSPKDYGWRYLVGRLQVWASLGLPVQPLDHPYKPVSSLRFSLCEPEDI